jgi:hypothetical protein
MMFNESPRSPPLSHSPSNDSDLVTTPYACGPHTSQAVIRRGTAADLRAFYRRW